jgi:rhodanese-related sulfurtransferase
MTAKRIDVRQAREAMTREPGAVYLDVRTEREFAEGHPVGAINIPVGTPNPAAGRIDPNPDFIRVARAALPLDAPILVGCRTGPRAEMAAALLAESGHENVRWVEGGWVGLSDAAGNKVAPGWLELGFPISHDVGEGIGYASLKRKAGA